MVSLISLLGWVFFLNIRFKWSLEISLAITACSMVLILYLAVFLSILPMISHTILFGGIGLLSYYIFNIFIKKKTIPISNGFIFFIASSLVFFLICQTNYFSYFTASDDFSHWGRMAKVIYENKGFVLASDQILFKDYPPGTALWYYYFFQFTGYSISTAFFANGVFVFAIISVFFIKLLKYPAINLIIYAAFLLITCYYFGTGFHSLMVDLWIAILFGSSITLYWLDKQSFSSTFLLALVIVLLPIIKSIGLVFSCILLFLLICNTVFLIWHKKATTIFLFFPIVTLIGLCLAYFSWNYYFLSLHIPETFNQHITLTMILNSFNPDTATTRQVQTLNNFISSILSIKMIAKLLLIFIAGWIIYHHQKKSLARNQWLIFLVCILGGFGAYLILLLFVYMFIFDSYQGVILASFSRYLGSYIVGLYLLLFFTLLTCYQRKSKPSSWMFFFLIIFGVGSAMPSLRHLITDIKYTVSFQPTGEQIFIKNYTQKISHIIDKNDNIYFVWQGSKGMKRLMFEYEIMPIEVSKGDCWSFGKKYYTEGVWTCNLGKNDFFQKVSHYDYIFLGHVDDRFRKRYGSLFSSITIKDGNMYKVDPVKKLFLPVNMEST